MAKQFRIKPDKKFIGNFRQTFYQSCYLKRLRSENYPIFEPELVCQNIKSISLKKRCQSTNDIYVNGKKHNLLKSRKKSFRINTQDQNYDLYKSENQKKNESSTLSSCNFDSCNYHENQVILQGSLNKILTRACIMRNQKKRQKSYMSRLKNYSFVGKERCNQLIGEPKKICSRQISLEHQNRSKSRQYSRQMLKQKKIYQSNKVLFKMKKKKCFISPSNQRMFQNQVEKDINAWDTNQQNDLLQFEPEFTHPKKKYI